MVKTNNIWREIGFNVQKNANVSSVGLLLMCLFCVILTFDYLENNNYICT